jgi:hypothetical protein
MLYKIPEYLVRTNCKDYGDKIRFMGERKAGIEELWDLMGGIDSASVQTLQRRMALQLGQLEKDGCIRLDQVWNTPNNAEMAEACRAAGQRMLDMLLAPTTDF